MPIYWQHRWNGQIPWDFDNENWYKNGKYKSS